MFIACLKTSIVLIMSNGIIAAACAQADVQVIKSATQPVVTVTIDGKPFTEFLFPDTLEKPVLYPIYAASGQLITRGYPVNPRPGEPTDHPHHLGLWFDYENVNGLDFWNNSFAIPADKKQLYGWIKTDSIVETKSGSKGVLTYNARWVDKQQNVLLKEVTTFEFSGHANKRIIDRTTTLTAVETVLFKDAKDGMLGLRVAHELQLPDTAVKKFTDDKGNVTEVKGNGGATGNYITSEGKAGNAAWGTRASWCMLYGKEGADTISIAIIDHPQNVGYPAYWHARDYGLFAVNPLGQKIFSNGSKALNFSLKKNTSTTFRYRIVINAGDKRLPDEEVNNMAADFSKTE
jgi:hypothetical protein